ncbi:MAG: DUF4912 domain-containing protein, partial [Candidatus Riflebacteria bacterium]
MAKKNKPADLGSLKREELYQLAQQYDVKGRSKLNKEELVAALAALVNQSDNEKSSAENEKKSPAPKKSRKAKALTEETPAKNEITRASKKSVVETIIKPEPEAPGKKSSTSEKTAPAKSQKKKALPVTEAKTGKVASKKKTDEIKPVQTKTAGRKKSVAETNTINSAPLQKARGKKGRKAADIEPSAGLFDFGEKPPVAVSEKKEPPAEKEIADCAKENILSRSFARQKNEGDARKRTGAIVQSVAIPVEITTTLKPEEPSPKARQIEEERSRRHASLKTTMEIPVFSTPASEMVLPVAEEDLTGDLPADYGETRIVVQVRDPHWAHAYWQIPRAELKRLEMSVGIFEFAHSHFVLRVHNVSDGFTQEFSLSEHARSYYFYLEKANTVYQAELGLQSPTEGYTFIALSNLVQTPPDKVAEHWAAPPQQRVPEENRVAGHELPAEILTDSHVAHDPAITEPAEVFKEAFNQQEIPAFLEPLAGSGQVPQIPEDHPSDGPPGHEEKNPREATVSSWIFPPSISSSEFGEEKKPGDTDILLTMIPELLVNGQTDKRCELRFNNHLIK